MSYEGWDDGGDDYMTAEQAYEAGWIDGDAVGQLQALLKQVEYPVPPRPGNRSDAALVLIDHILNPPKVNDPEDPNVTWARVLLKDVL